MTSGDCTGRRAVLQTVAVGGTAALAGCSGLLGESSNDSSETTTETSPATTTGAADVFAGVRVEGTKLQVDLADSKQVNRVDRVNVIGPNGRGFASKQVQTGTRTLSVGLLPDYLPGDHRVIAVDGETVVDETTIQLEPTVEIVEVGVARNHPDMNWDKSGRWELNGFATVKNTGNAPQQVTNLEFAGTPQPTDGKYGSDRFRVENQIVEETAVAPGETVTIYSYMYPFSPVEGTCEDTEFEVAVRTAVGDDVTKPYQATMQGDSLLENCTISIEGGT